MPVIANTLRTTDMKTNREELADVIDMIAPEDTPLYTMARKATAKSTHPEWPIDDLAAPTDNAQEEGAEFVYQAATPPERVGNYTQIFMKSGIVSGTQEVVDDAAGAGKINYQKAKKGVELRKDIEFSLVSNTPSQSGNTRRSGGMPTWITTNANRGSGGANGGYDPSSGSTVAETLGTQRDFTKDLLDDVLQQMYNAGASPSRMVCSPRVKSDFVKFMSDANVASFRYAAQRGQRNVIIGTADVYLSPFGEVTVVPNRVMATNADVARRVFIVDTSVHRWAWLRRIREVPNLARTGDAEKFVLLGEGGYTPTNEKGLGVVADVNGL